MDSKTRWFVAYVRSCQERKVAAGLAANGITTYVPVRKVRRQWSDRVKIIDQLLIPGLVFVNCDEITRRQTPQMTYGLCGYLTDRGSGKPGYMTVPDNQMSDFMRVVAAMNGDEDIQVVLNSVAPGDHVRIIRGPFKGMECECAEIQNRHKLIVRIGSVGTLLVSIELADVVRE